MYCNDCNNKDGTIKKLEYQVDDLLRENRSFKNNYEEIVSELDRLRNKYDQLNENFTMLENEFHQSEVAWENTLEQAEEDLTIIYENYLADLIEANPSFALVSKYEKVRRLAEKLIKNSSG